MKCAQNQEPPPPGNRKIHFPSLRVTYTTTAMGLFQDFRYRILGREPAKDQKSENAPKMPKKIPVPPEIKFRNPYYSQDGEDVILRSLFPGKEKGFYVDIGAHHPFRFSNTALFYGQGWRGINVDATPGSMAAFNQYRPEDINVEAAISDQTAQVNYYIFNDAALNTLDPDRVNELLALPNQPYRLKETVQVTTKTLAGLLEAHLPAGKPIDFLSIDVERRDLEVLRSNNWTKFSPKILLVECNRGNSPVHQYLAPLGYEEVARTLRTSIFQLSE